MGWLEEIRLRVGTVYNRLDMVSVDELRRLLVIAEAAQKLVEAHGMTAETVNAMCNVLPDSRSAQAWRALLAVLGTGKGEG